MNPTDAGKTDIMDNISGHEKKRIQGYDLARGVAIFAMVVIDFKGFFCIDETFPEWLYALIEYMDRRAAVALVMIAGASMTLMIGRVGITKSRNTFFKRAAFLMFCGILISRILSDFSMGRALPFGHVAGTAEFEKPPCHDDPLGLRTFSDSVIRVCRIFYSRYGGKKNYSPWCLR